MFFLYLELDIRIKVIESTLVNGQKLIYIHNYQEPYWIYQRMLWIGVLVCVNAHVVIYAKEIHVGSQIVYIGLD